MKTSRFASSRLQEEKSSMNVPYQPIGGTRTLLLTRDHVEVVLGENQNRLRKLILKQVAVKGNCLV
jgi:hypothetical protein